MSLDKCLSTLRASGSIDPRQEDKARRIYEEVKAAIGDELGAEEAAAKATQRAMERLKAEAAEKRRQTLLQAARQREIMGNMRSYRNADGQEDWAAAATAHFDADEAATFSNVEARRKAVLGQAHGKMTEVLATFRRDLLGRLRRDADLDDLVRVLAGEPVENAASRELGRAAQETFEFLRLRFNQAGGHIPKRKDWWMVQRHDMASIRRAGREQWIAKIYPLLDPSRMYDELTGRPMSPSQVAKMLPGMYDTLATGGWNAVEPSGLPIEGKLGNRRADPRILAFKDADSWLVYQREFGSGTPFDAMLDHINGMACDIASMEIFGPNPRATMRWLEQMITKRARETDAVAGNGKRGQKAQSAVKSMRDMWSIYSGRSSSPVNTFWGSALAGGRSVLVSALLGRATLSAASDLAYQRAAAQFNGLRQVGIIKNYLKLFRPGVSADQKLAVRAGLLADNWSTIALGQQRYTQEVTGPEFARRLADFTMRASLLSPWTQAGRWAFGMEFMGFMADNRGKAFSGLPSPLQGSLKRYGISADEWDIIRRTPLHKQGKATFLRPDDLAARQDIPSGLASDLATRTLEMIQSETDMAVPGSTLRSRATLHSDLQPGTVPGEVVNSFAMFKNFPISIITMHYQRMMSQKGRMAKAGYAANLIISTSLMGYLSFQMKQLAAGKSAVEFDEEHWKKVIGASVLQGGALGIYGDFLFSDVNRHDRNLPETVAGPVAGAASDTLKLTVGNAVEAAQGKKTGAGPEILDYAGRYTPGGNLWYLDLAYQRILLDQLRKEVDPDYQEAFRRMEARGRTEMDQEYWWKPGEVVPE